MTVMKGRERLEQKEKYTEKHTGEGWPAEHRQTGRRRTEHLGTDRAFCCVNRKPWEDSKKSEKP